MDNNWGGDRKNIDYRTDKEKENGDTNFLDSKFPYREIWADHFNDELMKELTDKLKTLSDDDKIQFGKSITFVSGGDFEIAFRSLIPKDPEEKNTNSKIVKEYEETLFVKMQSKIYSLLLQRKRSDVSEMIVEEFYKNNHIKVSRDDNNPEFKIYANGIYVNEGRTYIEEYVRKVLETNYSTQLLNDVINKISADNKVDFEQLQKDSDPYLLATKECLINLKTHELKDFSPEIIMFNKIPVKYDKDAKCPKILKFLADILETKEDIELVEEIIGFSLVNDYFMEKAIMFLGNGRNGKSKLLQLMKTFFGLENTCSVRLQEMNTQSSSIWELHNKFVNLAGDLSNTSLKETGLFKETTGRDPIQAKRKYKNDLKFTNTATHIFACNELPRVYDYSEGFWSRWVLIKFPYTFLEEKEYNSLNVEQRKNKKIRNPDIINDILSDNELSGLLNLAIAGLKRVQKQKSFSHSSSAEEVRNTWVRQSDSFTAFAMDFLEEDYDGTISKNLMRKTYSKYCRKYRLKNTSDLSIKITLENLFGVVSGQDSNSGERYWEGVTLKKEKITGITYLSGKSSKNDLLYFGKTPVMPVILKNKKGLELLKSDPKRTFTSFELQISIKDLGEIAKEGIIFEESKDNWKWLI